MAIQIEVRVGGTGYRLTMTHDDVGNYVAEAARLLNEEPGAPTELPRVRVVDPVKERALRSLFDSLCQLEAGDVYELSALAR